MRRAVVPSVLAGVGVLVLASTSSCSDGSCTENATCAGDAMKQDAGALVSRTSDGSTNDDASGNGNGGGTGGDDGDGGGADDASGGDGGDATVVDAAPPPPGCDQTLDPKDPGAAPCVADDFALFVDAGAAAGGSGTKSAPFSTISAAIASAAVSGKQRVFVCGTATYHENVALSSANAPWLIGGFDCGTWAPVAGAKASVSAKDATFALHIDSVTTELHVEDFAFEALAGGASNRSSIAAFVASSPNVTLIRVALTAHDGASGADGAAATTVSSPAPPGNNASGKTGGAAKVCSCSTGGASTGGKGGDFAAPSINGQTGAPGVAPPSPQGNTGAGQPRLDCNDGTGTPKQGSDAPNAADAPSPAVGALTASGWTPGDGAPGPAGGAGQGGGGGGSFYQSATIGSGGGGGGCGGCGGGGGGGGTAGGSSIALATFDSPVHLAGCTLATGSGASGGSGKPGTAGASGGTGGTSDNDYCDGAPGGKGGAGGAGAGGAGGISVAVLYVGDVPVPDGSTTFSPQGHGSGGAGAATATPNPGPPGFSGNVVPAP